MIATEPICLQTFTNAQEAHIARSVLEANGISGVVVGDQLSTTLAWYGQSVKKVELMVDQQFADEAASILREQRTDDHASQLWDTPPLLDWRCSACNEQNAATFDHCWSCEADRSGDAPVSDGVRRGPTTMHAAGRITSRSTGDMNNALTTDESPGRELLQHDLFPDRADDDETSSRALRAACLGLVFPVPLSFYSLYLCLCNFSRGPSSGRTWLALALSLPWVLALTVVLFRWLRELVSIL